jgi:hypothetical protein
MTTKPVGESFEAFKNSFSYGSRSDLNFKFLKHLSEGDAARFIQMLFWKLGETIDDGEVERLVAHIIDAQAQAYSGPARFVYDSGPFTPVTRPVAQLRLALLTSSGHFVEGDDPRPFGVENMTQAEAEARIDDFLKEAPRLSEIPLDTEAARLRVRHGGYDIRGALADPNVNFPIGRLRELLAEGRLNQLHPTAYSFTGACAQTPLLTHTGPEWVRRFQGQGIEAAVLVPV